MRGSRRIGLAGGLIAGLFVGLGPKEVATAEGPPVIERIEPSAGPVGTVVQVVGRRFGRTPTVTLGGKPAVVERSLPNRLSVRIPRGAVSGLIEVQARTGSTRGPEFRVTEPPPAPEIVAVEPRSGPPGAKVRIRGRNFSPRLAGNLVRFGDRPAVVRTATPVELEVVVPALEEDAPISVRVAQAGEAQSKRPFRVTPSTAIVDITPSTAPPGGQVAIRGKGFSKHAKANRVFLNRKALRVKSASPQELIVVVPKGAASGPLRVDVRGAGEAVSAEPFTVQQPPAIKALRPRRAAPGTRVTVSGAHFGRDREAVELTLGEASVHVENIAPESLTFVVPQGAVGGKLRVAVNGVESESADDLVVTRPLRVDGFSPRSGPAGSVISVVGQGFAATPAQNRVTVADRRATVLEASSERLTLRVPKGKSGPITVRTPGGATARTADPFVLRVPPELDEVVPMRGAVGSELRIRGRGFGGSASVVKVSLGDHPLEARSVRDDLIVARVTPGAKTAPLRVLVPLQGMAQTDGDFVVSPTLTVSTLEPARVRPGQRLTIRGQGFASDNATVTFSGGAAAVAAQIENERTLTVVVPERVSSGAVTVKLSDGRSVSSAGILQIVEPAAK